MRSLLCILRKTRPVYKFLLRNQSDSAEGDFVHPIDDDIRFEVKGETIFYQYAKSPTL